MFWKLGIRILIQISLKPISEGFERRMPKWYPPTPVIPVHHGSIPRFNQAYTSTTRYIFHTRPSTSLPHVKQNSMADTSRQHWVYFKVLTASYLLLLHLYNIYIYGIMEPLWSGSAVTTCDLIISAALVQLQQSIQFWFVQSLCQEAH